MTPAWIVPEWPAPPGVRAVSTLRSGGVSVAPWHSLNLGDHVGDDPAHVAENRRRLARALSLPEAPVWLQQVHGTDVVVLDGAGALTPTPGHATLPTEVSTAGDPARPVADAAVTSRPGRVLAVLTADCLPVLLCRADGRRIGVVHAGWRGLAAGVLEAAVTALDAADPAEVVAWIGPGIGQAAYEVGDDVRDACLAAGDPAEFFAPGTAGRWQFDLAGLARHRLGALGVSSVHGGRWCTFSDPVRFYSHRRDGAARPTGRMGTLLWLDAPG